MKNNDVRYKLGCHLVKGPRQAVGDQAAGEKSTTGNKKYKKHTYNHTNTNTQKKTQGKRNTGSKEVSMLNILQLNVCGIKKKRTELAKIFDEKKIHIGLLQETLHNDSNFHITGYTAYPCTCSRCRGIITYIRNDIVADVTNLSRNDPTDVQRTILWFNSKKYTVYNVYSPPRNICRIDDLQEATYHNTILAGDFNGHSPLWGYVDVDNTGKYIEELHESTNLVIQQTDKSTPTLLHRAHNTLSRPDLTLLSSDLDTDSCLQVLPDIGSDHRPILISLPQRRTNERPTQRTRWNFKKANWPAYRDIIEEELSSTEILDQCDINVIEESFISIILRSAQKTIPRGSRKNYKPFWNEDIESAVTSRQKARETFEQNPNTENKIIYNKKTAEAKRIITLSKKEKWTETCSNLDLRKDGRKAWKLLNNLSNTTAKNNPPIIEDSETPQKKAETFNKFFASINKSKNNKTKDADLLKELKDRENRPSQRISTFEENFTTQELEQALQKLKKRKSPGPDKIHNEMITELGAMGKEVLLRIINLSWETGTLPKNWRNSYIIPVLKKGKNPKDLKSYRPISLTSCIGKVAERMINKRLYWWLETSGLLCEEQSGFRSNSRTEDQLFTLCQKVHDGFQEEKHTTAIFVDLQQAYDRVWRKGLLLKIQRLGIQGNLYKWIKGFLHERTIQTMIEKRTSAKRTLEEGIPQGSSLSCTLFLIFINDMANEISSNKAFYADDLVFWHSHKYTRQSARYLNFDLEKLREYCEKWKITINTSKTVYSIFSMSPKVVQQNLNIKFKDKQLPKDQQPTYLGVQLDSRLNLNNHLHKLKMKATKRLALLKRLASTNWGSDMSTLRSLYTGYIRSVLDYNQSLQITCSASAQSELDKVQNHALRFICGGMKSTPTHACEIHTNLEPLTLRREKATVEMYERSKRMNTKHPARRLVDNWKPQRRLKHKSVLHHAADISKKHHLPDKREPLRRVWETPPNLKIRPPDIRTKLIGENVKKSSHPLELARATEDTIGTYPEEWIHAYTDGSAFKATQNAGYGVLIHYPNGISESISGACGKICSNFEAEMFAVGHTVSHLNEFFRTNNKTPNNIVVFTDSQSILQALKQKANDCPQVQQILLSIDRFLTAFPVKLVLQWIPGHTGIPGNEKADKLAKKGSQDDQPNLQTPLKTAINMLKNNCREEWMNRWANGSTARTVFRHMTTTNPKDNLKFLSRKDQSSIFRLRTQHAPLNNHLNRIGVIRSPLCPLCKTNKETTEHLLFECTHLTDLRQQLLPPNPNIGNTLYTTHRQLKQTATFYSMALSRRASA